MSDSKNQFDVDYEKINHDDFYATYCAHGDDGCDECEREGICCLACKHRKICVHRCYVQKHAEELMKMPTEEFAKIAEDKDDSLVCKVAADRIRISESRLSRLETAADAVILAKKKWGETTDKTPTPEVLQLLVEFMQAIDALAAAREGRE